MIKYIGSKRSLIPIILDVIRQMADAHTVIDLFSGTSRVGHALKADGYRVLANDHNAYAATLARCYVQADAEDVLRDASLLVQEFNRLKGTFGYFTETFCVKSRFFQPKNGEKVDAIRQAIAEKGLNPELEAVMLTALMEAADRVDSTTGLQMAYLKKWASRSYKDLALRVPKVLPRARHGKSSAYGLDVFDAVEILEGDLAYIDPPYNQHSYLSNYHIWESLIRWDKPEVYGVACKRVDVRERRSVFNSKPQFASAMSRLITKVRAPILIISFNNEGYMTREEMEGLLATLYDGKRYITVIENDFKRYVGAQIGIYSPKGEKVGQISHVRNKEFLYVVSGENLLPTHRQKSIPFFGRSDGEPKETGSLESGCISCR